MRSKLRHVFPFAILIAACCTAGVYGQDSRRGYKLKANIIDQPDSPLRVSVDRISINSTDGCITKIHEVADGIYLEKPTHIMLQLKNVSRQPIIAYALVSDGGTFKNVQANPLFKPIEPGMSTLRGFGPGGSENISYFFDYILFADGSAWGSDEFLRSKQIAAYFEGRSAALRRLSELAAVYPHAQELVDQGANHFSGYLSSNPAEPPGPTVIDLQTRSSWLAIVQALRACSKYPVEAAALADQMEKELPR